jgi:hypothetical protein
MLMPKPGADAVQALRRWLLAFKGELERLAATLSEARDLADGMAFDVEQVLDRLPGTGDQLPPFRPSPPRAPRAEDSILRRQVVLDIEFDRRADGSADVRLDAHTPFHLPRKLATLLAIIAEPTVYPADDGLVGWRSYDDVAAVLTKRTGRVQTAATLIKHISKLKNLLRKAGENAHLIETDHQGSVRFRRRIAKARAPAGLGGADAMGDGESA